MKFQNQSFRGLVFLMDEKLFMYNKNTELKQEGYYGEFYTGFTAECHGGTIL